MSRTPLPGRPQGFAPTRYARRGHFVRPSNALRNRVGVGVGRHDHPDNAITWPSPPYVIVHTRLPYVFLIFLTFLFIACSGTDTLSSTSPINTSAANTQPT